MRKPRLLLTGATYHVFSRINRREMALEAPAIKQLFIETLSRAKSRYRFNLESFCVMGNHVHLVITPGQGVCLSEIMRWVLSVFAMRWNRLHGVTGHLWESRFGSKILDSMRHARQIVRYVEENPVRAGLVSRAELWPFSALWHRLRGWSYLAVLDPCGIASS